MTLLKTHPERFGWRWWTVLAGPNQPARLMAPWGCRVFNGPRLDAQCPHGNVIPSPGCRCGLHFVRHDEAHLFFEWIRAIRPDANNVAVTFGVALGDIIDDAYNDPDVYLTDSKRAAGYRILTTFIHPEFERHADDLRRHHGTPVLVVNSERQCRATRPIDEDGMEPTRPSWFAKMERQPAWPTDPKGQRLNKITEQFDHEGGLSGLGSFVAAPAHIQELLLNRMGIGNMIHLREQLAMIKYRQSYEDLYLHPHTPRRPAAGWTR